MNSRERTKITSSAWRKMVEDGGYFMPIHDKPHTQIAVSWIATCEFPDLPEVRTMIAKIFEAAEKFHLDTGHSSCLLTGMYQASFHCSS